MSKMPSILIAATLLTAAGSASATQPPDVVQSDSFDNTAMGSEALLSVTPSLGSGTDNTAAGFNALKSNSTGFFNTAVGSYSLWDNTTGSSNTASGFLALQLNSAGYGNTASGAFALTNNMTGHENVAVGAEALYYNESGARNTGIGNLALWNNNAASDNTGAGYQALYHNFGNNNTATGSGALYSNTNGASNTGDGLNSLHANTTGYHNAAVGATSMIANSSGNSNSSLGFAALAANTTGSNNIAVGAYAGYLVTTGSNNIHIGTRGLAGDNAHIRIGTPGTHSATFIAGISSTHVTGAPVYVTSSGQLGVLASSERYKTGITSMSGSTEKLQHLRPVTFHLKTDPRGPVQYGLIAEEVARVYPELVIRNEAGRIEGVRYDELAPMLLNELQQEHQRLEAVQGQLADLSARLAEVERGKTQQGSR